MREEVDGNSLKRAMKVIMIKSFHFQFAPDDVQIKQRAAYHRENSCMNLKTKMALHLNQ